MDTGTGSTGGGETVQPPIDDDGAELVGLGEIFQTDVFQISEEELTARARTSHGGDDPVWDEFVGQMIQASCAFMAQEVLRGPPEAPYNGRFLIGEHHEEWDHLITTYDRLCILAPRDHGKCEIPGSLILKADGTRVLVEKWDGGHVLAYDTEKHKLVPTEAPPARPNGKRQTLKVTTKTGRTVTVTTNHPLRKLEEWVQARDLVVGDRIAVPYQLRFLGDQYVSDAWLIGYLVGNGTLSQPGKTYVSSGDERAIAAVRVEAESRGWEVVETSEDPYTYRINKNDSAVAPWEWVKSLGLQGTAHYKRVPECFATASDSSIAQFLSGYFDADGTVNLLGGGSAEFSTVNEDLGRDTQHFLTRLGVLSALTPKKGMYRGDTYWSWRVTVRGKDLLTLGQWLRLRGRKSEQFQKLLLQQSQKGPCSGPCLDRFPKEVWGLVKNSEHWFRSRGLPRPSKCHEPTREKLRTIAQAEGNQRLMSLVNAPILWDEVVSVEDAGEQETWSIHVPEFHNYVSNDIVNHNTFFFDFALPIWKILTQPNGSGFIFSSTQEQASRILGDIRHEIETNPRLQWLVPARRDKWSETRLRFSNGHQIYARGYSTRVRGAHPTWVVVDDGLNDETAYSDVTRQKQIDYFYTAITNMVVPGGQIIVVGTPFHQADLYADLQKNPEYEFRRYRAINEDEDGNEYALWPERYSMKRLRKRRSEIGIVRFTREFGCDPIADDMSLFPGYLFRGEPTEQPLITLGAPKKFWDGLNITAFIGVDFAMSTTVSADYTVVWVMGVDPLGNRWLMDIQREKGLPFQEQLSLINTMARKYEPGLVFLESNQMQRIFGDELIRTTDIPIAKFVTTAQGKNALDKGVPSLRVLLENKKFRIPRGDRRSVELTDEWIAEMRAFTWADGKLQSVGTHDDTVMACWICDQAIRQGAFGYSFGDEEAEGEDFESIMKELTGDEEPVEPGTVPKASGNLVGDEVFGGAPLPGAIMGI